MGFSCWGSVHDAHPSGISQIKPLIWFSFSPTKAGSDQSETNEEQTSDQHYSEETKRWTLSSKESLEDTETVGVHVCDRSPAEHMLAVGQRSAVSVPQ